MKRYDGLFIIDTAGQSDSVDEHITKLNGLISEAGGKVTNEQKIGRRGFVRIANNISHISLIQNNVTPAGGLRQTTSVQPKLAK